MTPAAAIQSGVRARLCLLGADDRDRLTRFVASSPLAHFKQLYEWGEILRYEGTRTVHLGAERDGELCGSLAIHIRKVPRSGLTFLSGSRGPLVDFRDSEALACLVDGARDVARQHRAIFLRVDPEVGDEAQGARMALARAGFQHLDGKRWSDLSDPRIVMGLDLRTPEEELFKGLRETHRRHIRGIAKKGIAIRLAASEDDVARFRDIMAEVGGRRGFPVRGMAYYASLWRDFLRPGRGALFLAERWCDLLAGLLTIAVGRKAWLLYTGLRSTARAFHPNEAVWWAALQWAKRHGVELFNFGGSGTDWPPNPDSPGYPVYSFKRGFGAEAVYLTGYYDLVFQRGLYRAFRLAEEHLLPRIAGSGLLARIAKG